MAFFRPFLSDPFFTAPSSSFLSPSSSLLFDDEPLFSPTPLYLYDNTPTARRRGGKSGQQQQQLKEQQAGSGDNAQTMVSGAAGSDKQSSTSPTTTSSAASPSNKQAAIAANSNKNNNGRSRQQPRLLSPLSLLTPFSPAHSLLASRAVLPSMSVDMLTSDAEYTVHASVPGVAKQDLHVTVEDGVLTIEAERREETKQDRRANNSKQNSNKQQQPSAGSTSPNSSTSPLSTDHSSPTGEEKYEEKAQPALATSSDTAAPMDTADSDEPVYHHVESFYGHISRSSTLPDDCNTDGMAARYEDGVLKISIPRLQQRRARGTRLEIQ